MPEKTEVVQKKEKSIIFPAFLGLFIGAIATSLVVWRILKSRQINDMIPKSKLFKESFDDLVFMGPPERKNGNETNGLPSNAIKLPINYLYFTDDKKYPVLIQSYRIYDVETGTYEDKEFDDYQTSGASTLLFPKYKTRPGSIEMFLGPYVFKLINVGSKWVFENNFDSVVVETNRLIGFKNSDPRYEKTGNEFFTFLDEKNRKDMKIPDLKQSKGWGKFQSQVGEYLKMVEAFNDFVSSDSNSSSSSSSNSSSSSSSSSSASV